MLTENNVCNWLQFMCKIIPNQEDKKIIRTFLDKHYTTSNQYTSKLIYHKYCK